MFSIYAIIKNRRVRKLKKRKKVLLGILIGILIVLWIGLYFDKTQFIDNKIYGVIQNFQNDIFTRVLEIITNFGGIVSLFSIAFITFLILIIKNQKKYGIAIMLNLMISSISYILLKNIIQRPRPPIEERLVQEVGYSFPSGHATNNIAFYILIIYLICQKVENKKIKNLLIIVLGSIPLIIGFSRIYLRVHYFSDVIAGFCLGTICVILFISFIYPKIKKGRFEL